jgi:trans-aconitate 2-methyltransferase
MERICEPELMDDAAQAQAYAGADFAAGDAAMVERMIEHFDDGSDTCGLGPRIVDLGCGPGNITFRLADRCSGSLVLGIDGSEPMLAIAEARRRMDAGWRHSVRLLQVVLPAIGQARTALPAGDRLGEGFSAVVSNSLLHHLHDPAVLWDAVRRLAAPGAAVYLQDLRRPPTPEAADAFTAAEMASAPEVLRRDYRHSLQAAFTKAEVAEQLERADLEGLQVQEVGPKYLEVWGRLA